MCSKEWILKILHGKNMKGFKENWKEAFLATTEEELWY